MLVIYLAINNNIFKWNNAELFYYYSFHSYVSECTHSSFMHKKNKGITQYNLLRDVFSYLQKKGKNKIIVVVIRFITEKSFLNLELSNECTMFKAKVCFF